MDEQEARIAAERDARLAAVFRDAAAGAPPAGFDAAEVVATSRRITRRRRSALAGGALAVLAVAGVGLAAGLGGGSGTQLTTAAAGGAPGTAERTGDASGDASRDAAAPEAARKAAPEAASAAPPADGAVAASDDAGAGSAGAAQAPAGAPLGPGTGTCADRQDPALRALVEQALPEVAGAPEAVTTQECRPGGQRGVVLEVRDGAAAGLLTVTYLPPGEAVPPPGIAQAPAAVVRTAPTASGGTVVVSSRAERAGAPSPFAGRLDAVVADLASRL